MNTDNTTETSIPAAEKVVPVVSAGESRKSGGGMVWLVLLLALAAIGLGAYACFELIKLRSDTTVADELSQRDTRIDQFQQQIESVGALVNEMQAGIADLERAQQLAAESLRRLAGTIAIDNTDLALAEAEQLLIMAVHHLTLQRDVNIALAALESAGQRLAGLDVPGLELSREQIAADMQALKSVNTVDITGLSLFLTDLSNRVAGLPLNNARATEETATQVVAPDNPAIPAWERLLSSVWQEFKGMFVVTRSGSGSQATLLPDENWFLYQNLRLQIETARLAIIRRDTETMRGSLQQVNSWLQDYFDTADNEVANILQTTDKMTALDLDPGLPDISSSLETLRAFIRSRTSPDTATGPATL